MNKKLIITALIAVFIGIYLFNALKSTAPIEIENAPDWMTLAAAQEEAKETDKLILVDVYEVGCKYCRAMEREVYPDSTVRAVLDAGYIPAKVDGNSEELISFNGEQVMSREWAQSYGVYVFPGTLIIDAEGNLIRSKTGFMNVDELRRFLY
ncbi:MAG: thioredoxin family protein [Balneolaceae bacterium]|nr:thioredoxin family protein [Balneolaceae bacterium]